MLCPRKHSQLFLSLLHYLFWSGSDRSVIYLCIIKLWKPGARLTESSSHVVIKEMPKSVKSIKYFQWTYKKYNCGSESPCDAWFCNRLHNLINFPSINLLVEYPAACIPRYSWGSQRQTGPDLSNEGFVFLQLRVRTVHAVCYLFTHINVLLSFSLKKSVEETTALPPCHGTPHNAGFSKIWFPPKVRGIIKSYI